MKNTNNYISRWLLKIALTIPLLIISGCFSRIPEPVAYPASQQQKMQASNHWQVLAADVASRINRELIVSDYLSAAVFIRETCGDEDHPCKSHTTSSFDEAFRDLLITSLVNIGVPVLTKENDDSFKVNYKVQLVSHRANRIPTIKPGLITAGSILITVFRNVPHEISSIFTTAILELANQNLVTSGKYEIIITTSININGDYLYRGSDMYYINHKDSDHYWMTKPQPSPISLLSPGI